MIHGIGGDICMDKNRQEKIIQNLDKAIEQASSYENILVYTRKQTNLTRQFLSGFINSQEYEYGLVHLKKDFSEIILNNLDEMEFALIYLGLPEEYMESAITHERTHYNEAVKGGLRVRFCLRLDRSNDGRLGVSAGTQININHKINLTDNKKRIALRNATAAPKDLSESDKRALELE